MIFKIITRLFNPKIKPMKNLWLMLILIFSALDLVAQTPKDPCPSPAEKQLDSLRLRFAYADLEQAAVDFKTKLEKIPPYTVFGSGDKDIGDFMVSLPCRQNKIYALRTRFGALRIHYGKNKYKYNTIWKRNDDFSISLKTKDKTYYFYEDKYLRGGYFYIDEYSLLRETIQINMGGLAVFARPMTPEEASDFNRKIITIFEVIKKLK